MILKTLNSVYFIFYYERILSGMGGVFVRYGWGFCLVWVGFLSRMDGVYVQWVFCLYPAQISLDT